MKKRPHYVLLTAIAALVLIALFFILRPPAPLDLSHDEQPFNSMVLPPKSVFGSGYMDGGSVGFILIDKTGAKFEIRFPINYNGIVNAHPTAYNGSLNEAKMVRLKDPARAKAIVIRLLREYGKPSNHDDATEGAIRDLSEPVVVLPSRFWKRAGRWFNEVAQDLCDISPTKKRRFGDRHSMEFPPNPPA